MACPAPYRAHTSHGKTPVKFIFFGCCGKKMHESAECVDGADCVECAICMEPITTEICTLACAHVFHSSCILQACQHDPRCPVCRCTLAKRSEPPAAPSVVNVELSMNDVDAALDEDYQDIRRAQANYAARRRRFLRNRPNLKRENDAIKETERALRDLERRISAEWARNCHALWMGPLFESQKRERALLMRRLRRRERILEAAVTEALGERPESSDDDDEESHLLRTIARLGSQVAANQQMRVENQIHDDPSS